jgi:hypothetical protein
MRCPCCTAATRATCDHCHATGVVCGTCHGAGFHWRNPEQPPCLDCDGTGRL